MIKNGTTYPESAPETLVQALEHYRTMERGPGSRLLIVFTWGEERGYVGRSTGQNKVPLLIHNRRSLGGEPINVGSILEVRTSRGGRLVWSSLFSS